jgi:prepilin-type N-terminal cleavage/methylation domain-containing protein
MKSGFPVKLLRGLKPKCDSEQGFTLIELLVVIIIIGILSAVALPSFLNQANKARESEARQYTGTIGRAQEAYYLEHSTFTTDFGRLGLGIQTDTAHYTYGLESASPGSLIYATAEAKNRQDLASYVVIVDIMLADEKVIVVIRAACTSSAIAAVDSTAINADPATNSIEPSIGSSDWEFIE